MENNNNNNESKSIFKTDSLKNILLSSEAINKVNEISRNEIKKEENNNNKEK